MYLDDCNLTNSWILVCFLCQAVQDFGSMCQERDPEEVKGVLPYWPRIYCKIAVVSLKFQSPLLCLYCYDLLCIAVLIELVPSESRPSS